MKKSPVPNTGPSPPMSLEKWRASGEWAYLQGRRIFYHDDGEGEVLLCLHGFPTASWDWHRMWPQLTEKFRVIAPDFPGFGFSDRPRPPLTFFEQTDLLLELLRHLGIEQAHVLAHDYGDTVAQELLARLAEGLPIRLLSVGLLNGGLFADAVQPRPIQRLLLSPVGGWVARMLNERRFRRSFAAIFAPGRQPSDAELEGFWRLVSLNDGHRQAHRLIGYMRERKRFQERWREALRRPRVPVRLVIGEEDPVSGVAIAKRYREVAENPDVVMLQGVGHYPQFEAPDAVYEACLPLWKNSRSRK